MANGLKGVIILIQLFILLGAIIFLVYSQIRFHRSFKDLMSVPSQKEKKESLYFAKVHYVNPITNTPMTDTLQISNLSKDIAIYQNIVCIRCIDKALHYYSTGNLIIRIVKE